MRTGLVWVAIAVLTGAAGWGNVAGAQTAPCVANAVGGAVMGTGRGMKNAPFTAAVKSSFVQKLADGNTIHWVTRSRQARDSAGRTMLGMSTGCALGGDGQMYGRFSVSVDDPRARTTMNWVVGDEMLPKVVRVFHQPEMAPRPLPPPPQPSAEQVAQQQRMAQSFRAQQTQLQKENHGEDLGDRDFYGVMAHGTRNTRTIPAGEEGNDQPVVVISENWMSKELGLMVMMISDDPRRGRTVTECEELNRGEPDPAVFAPPADYKVEEQTPMGGGVREVVMGTESR